MATQVRKPQPLNLNIPEREDVGRGVKFWTFVNRSSYYVFVRMDHAESSLDSDPDHVLEPYTTQRVDFPEAKDKVCWKPARDFPRAPNPTDAAELFGFMASDSTSVAFPASVLSVGLTDQPPPPPAPNVTVTGGGGSMSRLESRDQVPDTEVVSLKSDQDVYERYEQTNQGGVRSGDGSTAPTFLWNHGLQYSIELFKRLRLRVSLSQTTGVPDNPNTAHWHWNASSGGWANNTVESNSVGGTAFALRGTTLNSAFYVGNDSTFNVLETTVGAAGAGGNGVWEYWNGAAWTLLNETESVAGAADYKANGNITLNVPADWAMRTLVGVQTAAPPDSVSRYWVRYRVTNVFTTNPTVLYQRPPVTAETQVPVDPFEVLNPTNQRVAFIDQSGNMTVRRLTETNPPVAGDVSKAGGAWVNLPAPTGVVNGTPTPQFRINDWTNMVEFRGRQNLGTTTAITLFTMGASSSPPVDMRFLLPDWSNVDVIHVFSVAANGVVTRQRVIGAGTPSGWDFAGLRYNID